MTWLSFANKSFAFLKVCVEDEVTATDRNTDWLRDRRATFAFDPRLAFATDDKTRDVLPRRKRVLPAQAGLVRSRVPRS